VILQIRKKIVYFIF